MASVVVTITAPGLSATKTVAIADADIARWSAWALGTFPNQFDVNGVLIPRTNLWAFGFWVQTFIATAMSGIMQFEQSNASKTATNAIIIVPTTIT